MREFKPGEVALIRVGPREHVAVRDSSGAWLVGDSNSWRVVYDDMPTSPRVSDVRPLAVIDPEDREAVERLWNAWRDGAPDHRLAQDNLQAALREFADPKPPTCGAHINLAGKDFQCVNQPNHGGGHRNPDAEAVWGESR